MLGALVGAMLGASVYRVHALGSGEDGGLAQSEESGPGVAPNGWPP